ncbi:IS481 family transposase [Methylobacter sp. BBA5.1]|uniref:IS481 family transposase n=1 Tax=Methylobacter sp. BBA5.1 TaxID=1495064 RepID=UPI0005611161
MGGRRIFSEALISLRHRLSVFPARSKERRAIMQETAKLYGVSETTLYRALNDHNRPKPLRRSDRGQPRVLPADEMAAYCEIIAAMKIRTSNQKGRHLSTSGCIRLLEEFGLDTPQGFVKAGPGQLKKTTVNHYLKQWGYDRNYLVRQPPAVRFQAEQSNDCWQFDLSPSDLKQVKQPLWVDQDRAAPTLMLYSVVDDRSGAAYQEYHCVYGEDVEAALRFLFAAMSPKQDAQFAFQGIPSKLYCDSGPITRSRIFQQVMTYLGIEVIVHMPKGSDGTRVTARAKGKVERPFRTVKEMHETLYHFHEPQNEAEANEWLFNFLIRYNNMQHRSEAHSRMEDWQQHLPATGIRAMCSWDRFCTFAREPERRKVGGDARVSIDGISYEVDPDLAGETVVLWWGLFDSELYVEFGDKRYGPYASVNGPIPLGRYRSFKKTKQQKRAERIEALASELKLSRAALDQNLNAGTLAAFAPDPEIPGTAFNDPDPFREFMFPDRVAAKQAIAAELGMPLAKLNQEQLDYINQVVAETLNKRLIFEQIHAFFIRH